MKGKYLHFAAGLILGAALFGGGTALAAGILAEPSNHQIYVDGQPVQMEAYAINGHNYVQLRDVGRAVGFNVYWANGVQIDSDAPYTGEASPAASLSGGTPAARPGRAGSNAGTVDAEAGRDEIIRLTNDLRRENGIAELEKNDLLMQAAQARAEEMAATSTYSHIRPDGSRYNTVFDCPYSAENIDCIMDLYLKQQNKELAETAMTDWALSEGHRKNMLNNKLSDIGVGIAKGPDQNGLISWYCVQLYIYDGYTVSWVDDPILTTK